MAKGAAPRPRPAFRSENIPAELQAVPNWVPWGYTWNSEKGKWDKPPRRLDGSAGSSTAPDARYPFENALASVASGTRDFDGVGFVLTRDDPFTGIDLDRCIDLSTKTIEPWARAIVDELDSYTEISPSGSGLRVMVRAQLPNGRRRQGNLEMYDDGRYVTLTGDVIEQKPVAERQAQVDALHARTFPPTPLVMPRSGNVVPSPLEDRDLLERAENAKNGCEFAALYRGEHAGDHSAADLKLCSALAFWTGRDAAQMDRLFRTSGLMRSKWDERRNDTTYGAMTLGKAIAECRNTYEFVAPIALPHGLKTPQGYSNGRPINNSSPSRAPDPQEVRSNPGEWDGTLQPARQASLKLIDAVDLDSLPIQQPSFIVDHLFPEGAVVLMTGESGSCKTAMMLHTAVALAYDRRVGERFATRTRPGPTFYLNGELDPALLRSIMRAACAGFGVNAGDLPRGTIVFEGDQGMADLRFKVDGTDVDKRSQFEETIRTLRPSLIVLDTQRALFDLDEKEAANVRSEFMWLKGLARLYRCCIVVLHHLRKTNGIANSIRDRVSGSGDLLAAIDVHLALVSTNGKPMTALHFGKTRYPRGPYRTGAECKVDCIFDAPPEDGGAGDGRSTFVIAPPGAADETVESDSSAQRDMLARFATEGPRTRRDVGAHSKGPGNLRKAWTGLADRKRIVPTGEKKKNADLWMIAGALMASQGLFKSGLGEESPNRPG